MRVGWGFDAHRCGGDGPTLFAGVVVSTDRGLLGTSDADVVAHAVCDALLGAGALGDLGTYFPSDDPQWENADSMQLLAAVVSTLREAGLVVANVDVTVVAESTRVAPHRSAIRQALARTLGVDLGAVSVKATSTDGMGFLGRDEGIAATAVALVEPA